MRIEHGTAGHFICADRCCFRRHTSVGKYRVSTVGCYHPKPGVTECIGAGRMYETMVFVNGPDGEPESWTEIDFDAYDDANEAQAGHEAMIRKYEAMS